MRILLTSAAAILALAGLVPAQAARIAPEARLAKLLEGRTAGKPVRCLTQSSVTSSEIIDGTAIVYRIGGRLYVNRLQDDARRLDRDDILVTRVIGAQLCRMDIVRLIDRTSRFQTGFVNLGDFVPYEKRR